MKNRHFAVMALCVLSLVGCTSQSGSNGSASSGGYKVGSPYQVKGQWYYPREDYSYDETGIASWYGADFHGKRTANGEVYNKDELTAAHKTLPLPSLARVTNLENGKSIVVRVNDRGPFSGTRLIDLSQRSSQLLGFEGAGTAKVRVQVLADESKAIADALRRYGGKGTAVADNNPPVLQPLDSPSPESARLEPVTTTPLVHQTLLTTKPVAEAVQLKVVSSGQIYVQAGAFTKLDNATKLQEKLQPYGHTEITSAIVNGTKFYRVRVGPAANVPQADKLVNTITRVGDVHPRIVID